MWLPKANVLRSEAYDVALIIHNAGSSTACADIDTNVVLHMRMKLIARVSGQSARVLSRGLPRGHSKRNCGSHCVYGKEESEGCGRRRERTRTLRILEIGVEKSRATVAAG